MRGSGRDDRLRFAGARELVERNDSSLAENGGIGRSDRAARRVQGGVLTGPAAVLLEQEPRWALHSLECFADVESIRQTGFDLGADFHVGAGFVAAALLHEAKSAKVKCARIVWIDAH